MSHLSDIDKAGQVVYNLVGNTGERLSQAARGLGASEKLERYIFRGANFLALKAADYVEVQIKTYDEDNSAAEQPEATPHENMEDPEVRVKGSIANLENTRNTQVAGEKEEIFYLGYKYSQDYKTQTLIYLDKKRMRLFFFDADKKKISPPTFLDGLVRLFDEPFSTIDSNVEKAYEAFLKDTAL